jgi:hypothetical protein
VLRQPNGEWVHKSLVAKVDGATTPLEAAVIQGLKTNLSVPQPMFDGTAFVNRHYHEATLILALAATVADREGAIAQARRAGLPVDPELILRLNGLSTSNVGSVQAYGNLGTLALLAMLSFAMSALLRRRLIGRRVGSRSAVPAFAVRVDATRATGSGQSARRIPKAKAWDWLAVTSGTTSVPVIPLRKVMKLEDDDARGESRKRILVPA